MASAKRALSKSTSSSRDFSGRLTLVEKSLCWVAVGIKVSWLLGFRIDFTGCKKDVPDERFRDFTTCRVGLWDPKWAAGKRIRCRPALRLCPWRGLADWESSPPRRVAGTLRTHPGGSIAQSTD